MSPLEFMQRLAALVPRPRLHLIRFHGGPGTQRQATRAGGAGGAHEATGGAELTAPEPVCAHTRPVRMSWARLLKRVFEIDLGHCPNCGGELKIIAAILEAPVIGASDRWDLLRPRLSEAGNGGALIRVHP